MALKCFSSLLIYFFFCIVYLFFPFLLLLSYNWFTRSFDISGPGMDHIVSTCSLIILSNNVPILFLAWIPEILFDLPHYFLCSNTSADQPGSFLFGGRISIINYLVQKKNSVLHFTGQQSANMPYIIQKNCSRNWILL